MDETIRRQTIAHLSTYSSTNGSGITTQEQHQEAKNICIELLEEVEDIYCDYWNGENFDRTETVIAWMPRPKAYKAESEVEE